jgi:phosphatidylinositol dimannoside acyltransferase
VPRLRDRLTDAGYGLGWSVVCRLPESWAQSAFRFSADLGWRRQGQRVRVLEGNLRRVIGVEVSDGQLRALSRQAMRSYARYWLEAFRLPVMPAGRLVGGMRDTGHIETAFGYLAAGRGVVFALPHMGNYDLAGAWVIAKGAGSVTTVAERVKPESVYRRFVAFREGLGVEVLPASGGTSSAPSCGSSPRNRSRRAFRRRSPRVVPLPLLTGRPPWMRLGHQARTAAPGGRPPQQPHPRRTTVPSALS